jgi:hypothetical protein
MRYLICLIILSSCAILGPGFLTEAEMTKKERAIFVFKNKEDAKAFCKRFKYLETIEASSGTIRDKGNFVSTVNFLKRKAVKVGANAMYMLDHKTEKNTDYAKAKAIKCFRKPKPKS